MRKIVALLMCLVFSGSAVAASVEEDVESYVKIFSGERSQHSAAADTLSWMGLSDTRLFDIIERLVRSDAKAAWNDRAESNRVARYIRSLGFSGQPKYEATIKRFSNDRIYGRFSTTALEDLKSYEKWNPIISNRATFDVKYDDDVNRVANMLRADDLLLKRVGAKRVYFRHQDEVLLDLLAQDIKRSYATVDPRTTGSPEADSVAWMVKALGNTGNLKYKPLLQEVAAKAKDPAILRHARVVLDDHYSGVRR